MIRANLRSFSKLNFTMRSKLFLMACLLILLSCKEDEKPTENTARVSITGLEMVSGEVPGARMQASTSWVHTFPGDLSIVFKESETGKSFDLRINPNDFSNPFQIDLPFGSYSYEGQSADPGPSSAILPITVKGNITLATSSTNLILKGYSDFGLITFSRRNLAASPTLRGTQTTTLFEKSGFYYIYLKGNGLAKVDLNFTSGKKLRLPINHLPFTHTQNQFRTAGDADPDVFLPKDFSLEQRNFTLSPQGFPTELVAFSRVDLPPSQGETSGLAWIQGRLFSINDGGNAPELYELNPQTGALLRTIQLEGATNVDWEDLTSSPTHLFIGDFGNNSGNRRDLKILKISSNSILSQNTVTPEVIEFTFSDQVQFDNSPNSHNFDCEAMAYRGGQIHLFSKNWQDSRTKHYTLPEASGRQVANLIGSFDFQGLVTAADISANGNQLVLLGYENSGILSRSFVWAFPAFNGSDLGSTEAYRFFLGSPANLGQTEGVVLMNSPETKISGESFSFGGTTIPPKLFEVDLNGIINP